MKWDAEVTIRIAKTHNGAVIAEIDPGGTEPCVLIASPVPDFGNALYVALCNASLVPKPADVPAVDIERVKRWVAGEPALVLASTNGDAPPPQADAKSTSEPPCDGKTAADLAEKATSTEAAPRTRTPVVFAADLVERVTDRYKSERFTVKQLASDFQEDFGGYSRAATWVERMMDAGTVIRGERDKAGWWHTLAAWQKCDVAAPEKLEVPASPVAPAEDVHKANNVERVSPDVEPPSNVVDLPAAASGMQTPSWIQERVAAADGGKAAATTAKKPAAAPKEDEEDLFGNLETPDDDGMF